MNNVELQKEIEEKRNSLSTDRLDMSYGEIISMYQNDDLIINPEFQRLFRWNDFQKTRFIESILLGIPTPPIFVAEDKEGKWELVDGLQRLSTIISFFGLLKTQSEEKNKWTLEKAPLIPALEGVNIDKLPSLFQRNIKRAYCRVEIIKWDSNIDMRYELFNRLNTGGSTLTEQEIRNCIFRGNGNEFNNFIRELADIPQFIELVSISSKKREELYLDELVLRFLSLKDDYASMTDNLSEHMTSFMENETKYHNLVYEYEKKNFIKVINLLCEIGPDVFKAENKQFSSALYDGIMVSAEKEKKRNEYIRNNINYLFQNYALIDTDTVYENLILALEYEKITKKEKLKRINETLELVGLKDFNNKKIFTLSGGEQQRVALARIMLKRGDIILADEPTGNLDKENSNKVMEILTRLKKDGKTIIIVTHDESIANQCDDVIRW